MNFNFAYNIIQDKFISWIKIIIEMFPNLVAALIVFLFFIITGNIFKKVAGKILPKISHSKSVISLLQTLIYMIIILTGLFIALGILNLDKTVTSLLAGAGVIGLAIGFAFQEIAANFFSGILIAFSEPYQVGDIIEIGEHKGTVTKIKLRTSNITTFQGLEVLIPNKDMFTKAFINYTTTPERRIDLTVGVSYDTDLTYAQEIAKKSLKTLPNRIKSRDIEVMYNNFDASSINFTAMIWIEFRNQKDFLQSQSEAIKSLKQAFDTENINIPFPIRTVYLKENSQ